MPDQIRSCMFILQVAILLFVLLLWAGAISLFYHQWGKIRGIDDYQPDYVHANMTIHPNPFPEEGSEIGVSTYLLIQKAWYLILLLQNIHVVPRG